MNFSKKENPPGRRSDRVKALLKESILDGSFKPGNRLPSEDVIARGLQVSKVTVREALSALEFEGLIEKRRGMYGGSFVTLPSLDRVRDQVINYYNAGGMSPEEVIDFRLMIEPTLVATAAERRTDEDLEAIRQNISAFERSIDHGRVDKALAIEFHRLIGDACHNPMVSAVMAALTAVFVQILHPVPMTIEEARTDLAYCRAFYECLQRGDKDRARSLMHEHFETLSSIIRETRTRKPLSEKETDRDD